MWIKTIDNKIINTKFILKLYVQLKNPLTSNIYGVVCILVDSSKEILCECDSLEKANNQLNKFQIAWNDN